MTSKFAFNLVLFIFFPKITQKVPTFNSKLHDNYKPCMKAFNPENTMVEFDECIQIKFLMEVTCHLCYC